MTATPIDALAAPPGDGEVLIWPGLAEPASPGHLARLAERNRAARRAHAYRLLGRPVQEVLEAGLRQPLVIATGHQPGFMHPGVWAKNVAAAALARCSGGSAQFLVVDSDAVHACALAWPEADAEGFVRSRQVSLFDPPLDRAYESSPGRSADAWAALFDRVPEKISRDAGTALPAFLRAFIGAGAGPTGYVERWTAGLRAIESAAGVASPIYRRVSDEFDISRKSPGVVPAAPAAPADHPAALYLGHLVREGAAVAAAYNAALAAYRSRRGIRGRQHPIPDLHATADRIELPLWAVRAGESRRRVHAAYDAAAPGRCAAPAAASSPCITLFADDERLGTVSAGELTALPVDSLRVLSGPWQLRPRALVLTLYARLLACDLFIHGIGGAKYDQITDDIIRRLFDVQPPPYACISATARLGLPRFSATPADLAAAQRSSRDRRFNPQRFLDAAIDGAIVRMIGQRTEAIAEAMRLRREDHLNRPARRAQFEQIRRLNSTLAATAATAPTAATAGDPNAWRAAAQPVAPALDRIRRELASNAVAGGRDWFIGLYRIEQLKRLAAGVITQLGAG